MSGFSKALKLNNIYSALEENVAKGRFPQGLLGVSGVHKALVIHALCENTNKRAFVITPDEAAAGKMADDLNSLGTPAQLLPAKDISFISDQTRSREYEQQRVGALANWLKHDCKVVVLPALSAVEKTLPPKFLSEKMKIISSGDEMELDLLLRTLDASGYKYADEVEGHGQYAHRGGIVDFFPPDRERPLRLELWGDEIDTICEFEIESQRRTDIVDVVCITPACESVVENSEELADKIESIASKLRGAKAPLARERLMADASRIRNRSTICLDKYINLIYEDAVTPLAYMEDGDLLFVTESKTVKDRVNAAVKIHHEELRDSLELGEYVKSMGDLVTSFNALCDDYKNADTVYLDNFARGSFDTGVCDLNTLTLGQMPAWNGTVTSLVEDCLPGSFEYSDEEIKRDMSKIGTAVVFAGTDKAAKSVAQDLVSQGFDAIYFSLIPAEFPQNKISVIGRTLSFGFRDVSGNFSLITHGQISSAMRKKRKNNAENAFHSLDELHSGDYVVHTIHGIGIFAGIENLKVSGMSKDYIKIKYAKQDVLYVPVTQLDLVSKYIGPKEDTKTVKLNRLGGKEWEKSRSKVRAAVADMAKELTELYAKRLNTPGFSFSPDIDMQSDFERRFEYDETEDQLRCIYEIKNDMEKPFPMDRLLCGDVGFGKTEVALRAAFKCIADGKQCAILVPTTILAFQHYNTIVKRFDGFPVEIDMLSRFRTPAQQKKIIDGVRRGNIDIVVGTHRIISKDVEFKDLGLLIVDEEQRFGVAQKEKLKEKFPNVDVLTLSATPIPRTLNMAMTGIRDMSIIEEAPLDRHPVQTYVIEYDLGVIAQAIEKELRRGGQVYYLHNNVESIMSCAAKLHELVPEARIGIAHGKMGEEELSEVWHRLVEGEIDVLVCTTIIETGVDVPNANTLIIENADRFGLSQLHQIRGRIGRSSRRAVAYFTFTRGKELTDIAERRLSAIREYTEFGSGFKIAMRDLELRGAGSILGAKQHGHMEAVGYDMYLKILGEAIAENKEGEEHVEPKRECLIDVQIDAHIPDSYITNLPHRLAIYRRIADVRTNEDAMDVTDELIDRFGDPPDCVLGLIEVSLLRNTAAHLGIYEIGQRGDNLLLYWNDINMRAVTRLSKDMKGQILVSAGSKPYVSVKVPKQSETISTLKKALLILAAGMRDQMSGKQARAVTDAE